MSTQPNPAAAAVAREIARQDNGQFGEQRKGDPGEVLPVPGNEVVAQWHVRMSNHVDGMIVAAEEQINRLRATANKHNLAFVLHDAGVPAGARIIPVDWREEAEEWERYDVSLGEAFDADGVPLDVQLATYGAYQAGAMAGLGVTDWDEFLDDDGLIDADKVYAWAVKAHSEAGSPPHA